MISWTSLKFKTSALQVNVKGMKTRITHWEKVFAKEISDKYYFSENRETTKISYLKNYLLKNKQKKNLKRNLIDNKIEMLSLQTQWHLCRQVTCQLDPS